VAQEKNNHVNTTTKGRMKKRSTHNPFSRERSKYPSKEQENSGGGKRFRGNKKKKHIAMKKRCWVEDEKREP